MQVLHVFFLNTKFATKRPPQICKKLILWDLKFLNTTSAERQTNGGMFVCLYVGLIPYSDKPRNSSYFITSWFRWLTGLCSLIKHHWVTVQCEIGQTSVAQWMGSREPPFCVVIPSFFCVESAALCHQLEAKSVLTFSYFLVCSSWPRGASWQVSHQRGGVHGDRSSLSSATDLWPPTQTLLHPPTGCYICCFFCLCFFQL